MLETKTCVTCGKEKPLEEFHKYTGRTARSPDGHRAECKKCRNGKERERQRQYREARKQAE
jgi:hypothetical protein